MEISDLNIDPFEQFNLWYQDAQAKNEPDLDAMALATATSDGKPSVRFVLYKGVSKGGFLIYTNFTSRKAAELFANPYAALALYWPQTYRQIRVEGSIDKLTPAESAAYFNTRSRDSQIGARASKQSRVITDREELIEEYERIAKEFEGKDIPCPDFWGGVRLKVDTFEFWQGQEHRLHDRFRYSLKNRSWKVDRLAP